MTIIRRRHIIAVVATAGMAVSAATGPLAPAAQAQPNNGPSIHDKLCEILGNQFDADVDRASAADQDGRPNARDRALADAEDDLASARAQGCEWAAIKGTPTRFAAPPGSATTFTH
jgi:hypothetical protein